MIHKCGGSNAYDGQSGRENCNANLTQTNSVLPLFIHMISRSMVYHDDEYTFIPIYHYDDRRFHSRYSLMVGQ
jgi:hypothetical protein